MLLYAFPKFWNKVIKLSAANTFRNTIFNTTNTILLQNKMLHGLRQKASSPSSWTFPSPRNSSLESFVCCRHVWHTVLQSKISNYCIISKGNFKPVISITLLLVNWYHHSLPKLHFSPHQNTANLDTTRFINQIHQILKLACKQCHLEFLNGWIQKEKKSALSGHFSSWDKNLYKGSTRGTLYWSDHFSCQVLTLFQLYSQ